AQACEADPRRAQREALAFCPPDGDGGVDAVAAAGERLQRRGGLRGVARLAEDASAEGDRGVGAEDRRGFEPAIAEPGARRLELGPGDALHIAARRLAGALVLQGFGILAGSGQKQAVRHADLVEQLAAARAL